RHHRVENALCRVAVWARHQIKQSPRSDLPRKAPAVLAPAAGALFAAVFHDRAPVAVRLFLAFGDDHETDRFIGPEIGTTVEADEPPAEHREFDGQRVAFPAAGEIAGGGVLLTDMAVGKGCGVKLGRLSCLAVVEPQAG